jgi:hypothetical protein
MSQNAKVDKTDDTKKDFRVTCIDRESDVETPENMSERMPKNEVEITLLLNLASA